VQLLDVRAEAEQAPRRDAGRVEPRHRDAALARLQQSAGQLHQRRLAGAVAADQPDDLAADAEAHVHQRGDLSVPLADVAELEQGRLGHRRGRVHPIASCRRRRRRASAASTPPTTSSSTADPPTLAPRCGMPASARAITAAASNRLSAPTTLSLCIRLAPACPTAKLPNSSMHHRIEARLGLPATAETSVPRVTRIAV